MDVMIPPNKVPPLETSSVSDAALRTVTMTSALAESCPSLTVIRNVYVPSPANEAWVLDAVGLDSVTPVPLTTLQLYVRTPVGKPSSVAVDVSVVVAGSVIVTARPVDITASMFTDGALRTVTMTSALAESCPSLTVTHNVYVPAPENVVLVLDAVGLDKVTPVPLTTLQL